MRHISKYKEEIIIAQNTAKGWLQDDFEVSIFYPLLAFPDWDNKLFKDLEKSMAIVQKT